jgi:hypothetical protein
MSDLAQSEVRASQLQAPVAVVARSVLGCHDAVQAVMVLGYDGKILAYERALGRNSESPTEEYPLLCFLSAPGTIFYLRLNTPLTSEEIRDSVEKTIGFPYQALTR